MRWLEIEETVRFNEVDYVNAHGTATTVNDRLEVQALLRLFSGRRPAVSSTKSQVGHCLGAAGMALDDAGGILDTVPPSRMGVVLGTAYGGSRQVDEFFRSLVSDGPREAKPFLFPDTVPNAPASHIAMVNGITGPNVTFCQNGISVEAVAVYGAGLLDSGLLASAATAGGPAETGRF